ncbi:HET-domain-containing protein, partial [Rhizodiscina lignyota]
MRLLNAETCALVEHEFSGEDIPKYAILSHTWGQEEVSFQQIRDPIARKMAGFKKIRSCCEQALQDGLKFAWVDTCCIDKSSSAELSEAINSMWNWYKNAETCYAYLSDTAPDEYFLRRLEISNFFLSRWFKRGWTLQELIAPDDVNFFDSDWKLIGTKKQLVGPINRITGIDEAVLLEGRPVLRTVSVARKMSWAASRECTRKEDEAYCLIGIFQLSMPPLYGEGSHAFRRLQQLISNYSIDQSIFAFS